MRTVIGIVAVCLSAGTLPAANVLKVENTVASAGQTGVRVRIRSDVRIYGKFVAVLRGDLRVR